MAARTLTPVVPRDTLSARIEALGSAKAQGYADFIRTGEPDGPIPCWGAISERFERDFTKSADRIAIWETLVEEGDRRPLLLFLHVNRERPEVMAKVLEDAHRLPRALQRVLVSMPEVAGDLPAHLDKLDPAAKQLFEAGPEAVAREREQTAARIAQLTTFRYFVPDAFDPADEPGRKTEAVKALVGGAAAIALEVPKAEEPLDAETVLEAPVAPTVTDEGSP
jgi:hypothetical protein